MRTLALSITQGTPRPDALAQLSAIDPHLVFAIFGTAHAQDAALWQALRAAAPAARWIGCSTAGEITARAVDAGSVVLAAVRFDHTRVACAAAPVRDMGASRAAGAALAAALDANELAAVVVFGPGVDVNGSALIDGLASGLRAGVPVTGGLAADDGAFVRTWTLLDGRIDDRDAVAVGLYGKALRVGHGSFGGWQPFGPVREVTRSVDNVLYELDGEPALEIYRRYLGDHAQGLPASGLLFPFAMLGDDPRRVGLVRTILGIDEATRSLVMAGDMAQGGKVRLMHASTNALIDGARAAADAAAVMMSGAQPGLALLVSCVGRKLVMGGRVDEEVEAVAQVLGQGAALAGFYSNGEISPFVGEQDCRLHNQTMTITCLSE
jgi:hypothetical protein